MAKSAIGKREQERTLEENCKTTTKKQPHVTTGYQPHEMRKHSEISEEEQKRFERLWYYRSIRIARRQYCTAEAWEKAQEARRRIESTHEGDLLPLDPFELGVLMGELSALRWALGDDWGNGDS